MSVSGAGSGKERPKRVTSPYSIQEPTGPNGHMGLFLAQRGCMGNPSPTDGQCSMIFSTMPRMCLQRPTGETRARHPGEVGGWQSWPPRLSLPSQALGLALGTTPAESREEATRPPSGKSGRKGEGRHHP